MNIPVSQTLNTTGGGTTSSGPFLTVFMTRDPTSSDVQWPVSKRWINTTTNNEFYLRAFLSSNGVVTADWQSLEALTESNTLTGNTGGAVSPDASGNTNILGSGTTTVVGNPGTNTLTITASASGYPITPYVVGPSGQAGYQTIQSAINAANAAGGGSVWVQPGAYTENLTLFDNVSITAVSSASITGIMTPPNTGNISVTGFDLISATHIFNSATATSLNITVVNCSFSLANGYIFNLPLVTGNLTLLGCVEDNGSSEDGVLNNTSFAKLYLTNSSVGSGLTNPLISNGDMSWNTSFLGCRLTAPAGNSTFTYCTFLRNLTFSGTSSASFKSCHLFPSFHPSGVIALTTTSSQPMVLTNCSISCDAANCITGTGTIGLFDISFLVNSGLQGTLTVSVNESFSLTGENVKVANSATTVSVSLANTDNTSGSSNASFISTVGGAASGDPLSTWSITGVTDWSAGIDNSASDAWVLSKSATLGTSNAVSIDTALISTFSNNIIATKNSAGSGISLTAQNQDNTNTGSHAFLEATVGGTSGGDAYLGVRVTGGRAYAFGIDTPTSGQPLKISTGTGAGTNPSAGTDLWTMTSAGARTMPLQPAFMAYVTADQANVTGDNTAYTIITYTENFDQQNNFNPTTGVFTAPVTGKYLLNLSITLTGVGATHTGAFIEIQITGQNYGIGINPAAVSAAGICTFTKSILIAMTAGDTAIMSVTVSGGTKTVGIRGTSIATDTTRFSGNLMV